MPKKRGRPRESNPNAKGPACLFDDDWLRSEYSRKTSTQIAKELSVPRSRVAGRIRAIGLHSDRSTAARLALKKSFPNGRRGSLSANWKGGRVLSTRGKKGQTKHKYWMLYKPEHPKANSRGYVMEHRLMMEEKLGRQLTDLEVVHHINGDKMDNNIENLELHTRRGHMKEHLRVDAEMHKLKEKLRQYEQLFSDDVMDSLQHGRVPNSFYDELEKIRAE